MQMFVLVLNKVERLERILEMMLEQGIGGATVLDSTGMMRVLDGDDNVDLPMMGLLRHFYSPERKRSKTMFAIIRDEQRQQLTDIINEATGGLDQPDTGICFCIPTTYVEGLEKKK
ncbi:MAG: hypothetical protein Q4E72_09180 [bacterium]|nr:hypothetical protein [bacterium]